MAAGRVASGAAAAEAGDEAGGGGGDGGDGGGGDGADGGSRVAVVTACSAAILQMIQQGIDWDTLDARHVLYRLVLVIPFSAADVRGVKSSGGSSSRQANPPPRLGDAAGQFPLAYQFGRMLDHVVTTTGQRRQAANTWSWWSFTTIMRLAARRACALRAPVASRPCDCTGAVARAARAAAALAARAGGAAAVHVAGSAVALVTGSASGSAAGDAAAGADTAIVGDPYDLGDSDSDLDSRSDLDSFDGGSGSNGSTAV